MVAMRRLTTLLILCSAWGTAHAQSFAPDVAPLIEAACVHCHDDGTETGLNLQSLGHDLTDADTFRAWVRVFDRVADGEMPPESEARPDPAMLKRALASLRQDLRSASQQQQQRLGRVPARRLTKAEFGYTLKDLLLIDSDVTSGIPDEVESGSFDTVGANQRISAVHMESYLQAADQALDLAIQLGRNPYVDHGDYADHNFSHLEQWHDKPLNLGGSITRKLRFGRGIALFADVDYLTQFTYGVGAAGMHRLTAKIAAYQAQAPITAKFIVKDPAGGARLVKAVDLQPGEPQEVVIDTYLQPGETPYLTLDKGGQSLASNFAGVFTAGGAQNYKGPGLAILKQKIEGPIFETWPPQSTQQLLDGVELKGPQRGPFSVASIDDPLSEVSEIVTRLAPRVFRRPVADEEIQRFVDLAKPAIAEGRPFIDVFPIALRSMLSSPQFLLFDGQPGELDDYALANRLSYFLWKSMPDEELFALATDGKLTDPDVLAGQVDRMLEDPKSSRFVKNFVGQWLRLDKVNVTSPDEGLFPEFDELLSNAIPQETELFIAHLIKENLSLANLIDSDFAFVNRRLAEHYGIEGVEGQEFRKVKLPSDSPRGGVLTQAAILKTTANGTTTSPVMRGNFVLTNFLGTPPATPPPAVGSIEPDTRGQTTIREILAAHRDIETCNKCHREIDPPGFALESFNPIGGYRTHYRISGGEQTFGGFTTKLPPKQGREVDASGVTSDGQAFSGIKEFKQQLFAQQQQVARNFISQLVVYATGAEIQFADRERIAGILERTSKNEYPTKDIIHEVVRSELFRRL